MAGAVCPNCGKQTVFKNNTGRACSNPDCNFKTIDPVKKGKGKKCFECKKFTVGENGKCRECGTQHFY